MSTEIRIRKSIDSLGSQERDAFIHAIQKLREISDKDPESKDGYGYFAALHDDGSVGPCEHGRDTFLPWHRALLFMFEEALRRSDPPVTSGVTLPYWDWSQIPTGQRYPRVYEDPQFPMLSDFTRNDTPICREGQDPSSGCQRLPFPRAYLEEQVLSVSQWSGPYSFGGADAGDAPCPRERKGYGTLEQPAHNDMHSLYVGHLMGNPATAAEDPIFWVYHCYIDLLWVQWQQVAGNTVDTCLGCRLCGLFKDAGETQPFRVRDVLDTETQLHYRYEYAPAAPPAPTEDFMAIRADEREFPTHPAVDFALTGENEPEVVRRTELTIPQPGFGTARLRFEGIKLRNPFSYQGNIYLTPPDVEFAPRERAFRERYLADIFSVWRAHEHPGHEGHAGHDAEEIEITADLTRQLASLAERHAGETWIVTVALVVVPADRERFTSLLAAAPEAADAVGERLDFRGMSLDIS